MKVIQLKTRSDFKGKDKGYEGTYSFHDESGALYLRCDIYGACLKAPTRYVSDSDGAQNFVMRAKGKFMNATYYLEDSAGERFATLTRKGMGFRWKVLDNNKQEVARIVDTAAKGEAFLSALFAALPDSYAVISNQELLATISDESLSEANRKKPGNALGRVLDRVFGQSGLTARIEPEAGDKVDTRILVAGITLLRVHDILGVNRQG